MNIRTQKYKIINAYRQNQQTDPHLHKAQIRLETYIQLDIYLDTVCLNMVLRYAGEPYDEIFRMPRCMSIKDALIDNIAICEKLNDIYIHARDEYISAMSTLLAIDLVRASYILES